MIKKPVLLLILLLYSIPLFAQSVDTAWVRRYDGPVSSENYANAIGVDHSGCVYVTGRSALNGASDDYCTIKYYPNGDTGWVRIYNGTRNGQDQAEALVVDDSGNVYVTGMSAASVGGYDYATIKYNSNGDTVWVRRYNGPAANSLNWASAIAVDGSGNVYVTGYSRGTGNDLDFATIKYYPNGDTAWVRRYNGTADSTDFAEDVAVDISGNVYVTGRSIGNGTHWDYATLKYYPNGDTAWVRRYNGSADSTDYAWSLTVDSSGDVYVTGTSISNGISFDYATIKYYPNGDSAWVRIYNGPGSTSDFAWAIVADCSDNIYVTGYSSWISMDYLTIKYYPNGDTAWVRRYNGTGYYVDEAVALTTDESDNVYVTGYSHGSGSFTDYATLKYDSSGNEIWVARYNGLGNDQDGARALAVDDSGNVYVTGFSCGIGTDIDYATIKYVQFLRGDANRDVIVDIVDVVYLVNYVLKSGSAPVPIPQVGDVNCDDVVDIIDAVYLVNYLFKFGPGPCQ